MRNLDALMWTVFHLHEVQYSSGLRCTVYRSWLLFFPLVAVCQYSSTFAVGGPPCAFSWWAGALPRLWWVVLWH